MEKKDVYICRCEEITEGEVLKAIERGARDIDGVKRLTRAGMGLCQGKTCSVLVRNILSRELKIKKEELESFTTRPPLRPIPSRAFLRVEKEIMGDKQIKKVHK